MDAQRGAARGPARSSAQPAFRSLFCPYALRRRPAQHVASPPGDRGRRVVHGESVAQSYIGLRNVSVSEGWPEIRYGRGAKPPAKGRRGAAQDLAGSDRPMPVPSGLGREERAKDVGLVGQRYARTGVSDRNRRPADRRGNDEIDAGRPEASRSTSAAFCRIAHNAAVNWSGSAMTCAGASDMSIPNRISGQRVANSFARSPMNCAIEIRCGTGGGRRDKAR